MSLIDPTDPFWQPHPPFPLQGGGAGLLGWWRARYAENGGRLPRRDQFRPETMRTILSGLVLADVIDGRNFRYRLIGTGVTGMAGRDATGHLLDEQLYGPNFTRMIFPYRMTVERRVPLATRSGVLFADRWSVAENLFLPLSTDPADDRVNMVMVHVHTCDAENFGDMETGVITTYPVAAPE